MHVLNHLPAKPDPANMLRRHVVAAVHEALEAARRARLGARTLAEWQPIRERWLGALRAAFPPELFAIRDLPLKARVLARHERRGYVIETVVFESLWGWEVNAHLCLPAAPGPWPAVICPTGHSPKTGISYQVPPVIFARNGLAAITFDAPGQGEKAPGGDHFHQGSACLLTGLWSETFFAMDALRAIDYLASRPDIGISMGVGMTGVSGGGETTMTCVLLDDRIRCIAPVCCTGPQRVLGAEDMYTSCPETMGPGLFGAGIDVTEKLAMAAPTPCLIVNAEQDEVYYPSMVAEIVGELRHTYALYGCPDRLEHFEQPAVGHAYTATMAERVAAWMRQWLLDQSGDVIGLTDPEAVTEPPDVINCRPSPIPNMLTINAARAASLRGERQVRNPGNLRDSLRAILAVGNPVPLAVEYAESEMSWRNRVERIAIKTEADVWAPMLFIVHIDAPGPRPTALWIDERGKWTALEQESWLLDASGFLQEYREPYHVCCLDARGWGETTPEHVAYDLAGWNDITRILAYLSVALGRCLTGQRVRDVLAALRYLRTRDDVDGSRIIIGGRGQGALVALFAALLDGEVTGFLGIEMLAAYGLLAEAEAFTWTHDIVVPNVLRHCDVAEALGALHCPTLVLNPVGVQREPVMDAAFPPTVAARPGLGQNEVGENALAWMRRQFGDTASSS
jgi:dienelactone hydrolase